MPPAVVAVGGAALAGSAAFSGGIVLFGTTLIAPGLTAALVAGVGVLSVGFLTTSLAPKPKGPSVGSFTRQLQDNVLTIRQAAAPRKIVFGRTRVGGVYTFMHTTGSNNSTLHTVATVAGHPVRGFDALFLDDEVVPLDSNGDATGKYEGKVSCIYGLGTTAGDSDFNSALTAAVGSDMWGANHLQAGCAKAYVKFVYDEDLFGGGLPNPSFVCSGYSGVEDPRFATSPVTTGWTDNAALCIAQYLRDTARGLGYTSSDIDETALIAAANDCDEMVTRVTAEVTFTAEPDTEIVTVADSSAHLRTGTRFTVTSENSPSTLPAGLSESTNYFWIPLTPTTGKVATSLANARAGTAVNITSAGTGEHTLSVNAEPRYTCNGWIDTSEDPGDVLPRLLGAMAGTKVETGGKVVLLSGVWRSASNSISEDEIDGRISSQHRRSRRDVFNGIKGVFVNPDDKWQPTDFPAVKPAAYLTEDNNERIWKDAELKFTDSPSMAQRIVRIDLEKNRRQQSAYMPLTLAGMKHRAGDTITVNNTKRGWSSKTFSVESWTLDPRDIEGENPRIGTAVNIEETDANVYAWTPGTDEAAMTPSPLTTLPDAFTSAAPTGLSLSSGTAVLGIRLDGTVFSRIKATWTAPADAQVTSGGVIEVQYKLSSASTWQPSAFVDGATTETLILDVDDGEDYDVRIRSRRGGLANPSAWVTQSNYTVVGKTENPTDVTTLSVQQSGVNVNFTWSPITDADLDIYEIRFMVAPFVWSDARECASAPRGRVGTTAAVPPSKTDEDGVQIPWVFGIKARDTSGNYSDVAATKSLTVVNPQEVVSEVEQWPLWSNRYQGWAIEAAKDTGNIGSGGDLVVFAFSSNGEKAFGLNDALGDFAQYTLTTPFDISSAEPDLVSESPLVYVTLGISGEISDHDYVSAIRISADGTEVFVSEAISNTNRIYQYTLSSAWDFSTASYTGNSGVLSGVGLLEDFVVSTDGTKIILIDTSRNLREYALGTPFDITTLPSTSVTVDLNEAVGGDGTLGLDYYNLGISEDGRVMLLAVFDGGFPIRQVFLGTPWDITTIENIGIFKNTSSSFPTGANFITDPSGQNIYFLDGSDIYQYALSSMLIRNPLTGNLNPASTEWASGDDFDVFDNYVDSPVSTTIYPAGEVDIGKDVSTRIWADVQAFLGPGETGNADAEYQVDYRKAADDYDGFEGWTVGEVTTRYVKNRVVIDQTSGATGMKRFRPTVDAQERTEDATGVAVSSGGTAVVFDTPFVNPPFLRVWNNGNDGNTADFTNLSATGFTAWTYDGSTPDDGTIRWEATGV